VEKDGTAAGTVLVEPFVQPVGGPYSFAATNGALYFAANDYDTREFQLWRSNGTPGGTSLVQSIAAGVNSSGLGQLTAAGDTLFFVVADNGGPGGGLWRSDGTAAGTTLVRHFDIAPGGGLWPGGPVAVGGTLFFAANCGYSIGTYLWKSDGNPSGTVLVSCNMDNGGYTANLTAFGRGTVFYTSGSGLWRSDGTSNGTAPVRLFAASPADLQPMNDTLFFTADDGHTGYELWKTDGTEAGTMLVQDINTAPTVVPCVGDCDAAGGVTVGEILTMVDIALGGAQPSACPNGIPSGSEVNVALILQAVNNALNGCGG
jgi:ELWxxDGT repeat protein